MSHLFERFDALRELRPALFFAAEVCRAPDPGRILTLQGAGYVASGEAAADKLPIVHGPAGLILLAMEGAGEVQTPLRVRGEHVPKPGDPVVLLHAKAGELAERFDRYLLAASFGAVMTEVFVCSGWSARARCQSSLTQRAMSLQPAQPVPSA